MASEKKEKNQQIQVFVRVRPLNKNDWSSNIVNIKSSKEITFKHHSTVKSYNFDRVFGPESTQIEVYKLVAQPTVREVIAGYNCTVLAYGQTGTGKTYTMAGKIGADGHSYSNWFEDEQSGIIPRTLSDMFDELRVQQLESTVRASYIELYNEEIFDLLAPIDDHSKLKLYDDGVKKGSVIVHGLTEVTVNSKGEVFKILEKGAEKRKIASTLMNSQSSRSHTVFCITVHTKENCIDGEDLLKTGKLYLVDLAGSENIKQSGATDLRAREAFSINQSLLTLGRCMSKLLERSAHIPFRESKLTRLLQDSLGGRTKTTLLATVSPAHLNADESFNTLEYANRAKNITTKPEINQRLSKKTLLKEYTEEIDRLRKDLLASRSGSGVLVDSDNYDNMLRDVTRYRDELAEKIGKIRAMEEQQILKERICDELRLELEREKQTIHDKDKTINTLQTKLQDTSQEKKQLQEKEQFARYLVDKYNETEEQLRSTAQELLAVVDCTTVDSAKLHKKVDSLLELHKQNKELCEQHMTEYQANIGGISSELEVFHRDRNKFHVNVNNVIALVEQSEATYKDHYLDVIDNVISIKNNIGQDIYDLQCNSESVSKCAELAESVIAKSIDTAKSSIQNQFNTLIMTPYNNLVSTLEHQEALHKQTCIDSKQMLNTNITLFSNFIESCKEKCTDVKEKEHEYIKYGLKLLSRLADEVKLQNNDYMSYKSTMEVMYNKLTTILQDMQNLTNEYSTNSGQQTLQCLQVLESMRNGHVDLRAEYNKSMDKTYLFMVNFRSNLQEKLQNNTISVESWETKQTELTAAVNDYRAQMDNSMLEFKTLRSMSLKQTNETCNVEMSEVEKFAYAMFVKHSIALEKVEEKLRSLKYDMKTNMDITNEAFENVTGQLLLELKESEKHCDNLESRLMTQLDKFREINCKIRSTGLKEYKTTGETPQRRSYRYPRVLAETKPRDKLVSEFQEIRSASASRLYPSLVEDIDEEKENLHRTSSETNIPEAVQLTPRKKQNQ